MRRESSAKLNRRNFFLALVMLASWLVAIPLIADDVDDALIAFESSNFAAARQQARKHENEPLAKFVLALCCIHHSDTRNYSKGFTLLEEIYLDEAIPNRIRVPAKLTCARTAHILDRMDQLPSKPVVDYRKLYREIIELQPPFQETFEAAAFLGHAASFSEREDEQEEVAEYLEVFAQKHAGDSRLTPLCLWFSDIHVWDGNYEQAVPWLERAIELGVSNPKGEPQALYALARLKQRFLHDRDGASRYYNEFLKRFPFHYSAPRARRHLEELASQVEKK